MYYDHKDKLKRHTTGLNYRKKKNIYKEMNPVKIANEGVYIFIKNNHEDHKYSSHIIVDFEDYIKIVGKELILLNKIVHNCSVITCANSYHNTTLSNFLYNTDRSNKVVHLNGKLNDFRRANCKVVPYSIIKLYYIYKFNRGKFGYIRKRFPNSANVEFTYVINGQRHRITIEESKVEKFRKFVLNVLVRKKLQEYELIV